MMAEGDFSCIKQVVKTVQIPLPATFISNETSGIAEILDSWKRQYKPQLQGVVVNYKHYSLSSSSGFIAPNKPYAYYNVTATFDLFCPNIGDIVKGRINRISKEHIGCLIEETINVTIHLSKDSPQDLLPFISLNRDILFEVSNFNYDRKMIRVKGKITPECVQLMREIFPPQTFHDLADSTEIYNNTDEGIGTSCESADDGILNRTFDDSQIDNDDVNFKKPLSSNAKSKKHMSKKPISDSEFSFMDASDEKPKKKKNRKEKNNITTENCLSSDSVSNTVSSDTLIESFVSLNHVDTLKSLKQENSSNDENIHFKKHKKKKNQDSSTAKESTQSKNYSLNEDVSNVILEDSEVTKTDKLSKKRKRESESSFYDTSEQSTADEMPRKKKKHKDKTISLPENEIKDELHDSPMNGTIPAELLSTVEMSKKKKKHKDKTVPCLENDIKNEIFVPDDNIDAILSLKKEVLSPVKAIDITAPKSKKKKNKDKKLKEKKKGKILASGAVLKKDKKPHKKDSKKNKIDGKQSKKHKKGKSHKKDKSEKKKSKNSKSKKVSDVIKSEND